MRLFKSRKRVSVIAMILAVICLISCVGVSLAANLGGQADMEKQKRKPNKVEEVSDKRNKWTKTYLMDDGSYTMEISSEPLHYKEDGEWKEIDYRLDTASNDSSLLSTKKGKDKVKVAKKANNDKLINIYKDDYSLSFGMTNDGVNKKVEAVTSSDAKNSSTVLYEDVLENVSLEYEISPTQVKENIILEALPDETSYSFMIQHKGLELQEKDGVVEFVAEDGKTQYSLGNLFMYDAEGVSSNEVELTVAKKNNNKTEITITPDRAFLEDSERVWPIVVDPTVITSNAPDWSMEVGAAMQSEPNYTVNDVPVMYCEQGVNIPYIKMSYLPSLIAADFEIIGAELVISETSTASGENFRITAHEVTSAWTGSSVSWNNQPTVSTGTISEVYLNGVGTYKLDMTEIVQDWYAGTKGNHGVALHGHGGANAAFLSKNTTFEIRYESVEFDNMQELNPDEEITVEVTKAGQENFFSINAVGGLCYGIETSGNIDTLGSIYGETFGNYENQDNGAEGNNFRIIRAYWGTTYLKVTAKNVGSGSYTLKMTEWLDKPEINATKTNDGWQLSWTKSEKVSEYQVSFAKIGTTYPSTTIYCNNISGDTVTYDYAYPEGAENEMFWVMVKPKYNGMEGSESKLYVQPDGIEWEVMSNMPEAKNNFSYTVMDNKIYTLGGWRSGGGSDKCNKMSVYDTKTNTWEEKSEYPAAGVSQIQRSGMVVADGIIFVIGGMKNGEYNTGVLNNVYAYNPQTDTWTQKANLPVAIRDTKAVYIDGKIYCFGGLGLNASGVQQQFTYDIATDTWTSRALNMDVLKAVNVNGNIYCISYSSNKFEIYEFNPSNGGLTNLYGYYEPNGGVYGYGEATVVNGQIYMAREEGRQILCYDTAKNKWEEFNNLSFNKTGAVLVGAGKYLYSMGGYSTVDNKAFDLNERYAIPNLSYEEFEMEVEAGKEYDIDVKKSVNASINEEITLEFSLDDFERIRSSAMFSEKQVKTSKTQNGITPLAYGFDGMARVRVKKSVDEEALYAGTVNIVPLKAKKSGTIKFKVYRETIAGE